MSQEDPNIFFRELMKSKPTPETRADWLANHLKLVELGEKKEEKLREVPIGFVRDDGSIRLASGEITYGHVDSRGYRKLFARGHIHRLVAEAFVENPRPDIFNVVDHINCDKLNNHYTNLRWVDTELNSANRKDSRNVWCHSSRKNKKKRPKDWLGHYMVGGKRTTKCFETEDEAYEWAHREKAVAWQKLYEKKLTQTKL
jgi:hypothetical protein